jgi:hypothetical protein
MATGTDILNSKEWQNASEEERGKIFSRKVARDPDYANQPKEIQDQIYERFFPKAEAVVEEAPPAADTSNFAYPEIEVIAESDTQAGTDTEAKPKGMRKDTAVGIGAGVGAVSALTALSGLIKKYDASPDKLQRDLYAKALRNVLEEAGISAYQIKDEKALINMARQLVPQMTLGQQEQLGRLQQQADVLKGMTEVPTTTGFPSELEQRMGRASGPKVEGASAASNWMRSMAGEGHQLPEKLLATAEDMTKANPKGGQALINQDLANLQKIRDIGGGQYQLAGKGAGQLMLPPEAAGQMEATQAARVAEETETARDALRVIRPQIVELEQEIARLQTLGKDATQFMARLEGLRRAESVARARVAKGLNIPAQANVGALSRLGYRLSAPGVAGLRTAGPMAQSAAGGAGAALNIMGSMEEEDPVAKALNYLAAGFDVASMVPQPFVKGVGTVGGLGMIPVQMGYEKYLKPPKKSVMDKK